MDNDGERIVAKYYDDAIHGGVKEQKNFEKTLFNKTAKSDAEILLLDGLTIVFKERICHFES